MGWNGSDSERGQSSALSKKSLQKNSAVAFKRMMTCLISCVLITLGAITVAFIIFRKGGSIEETPLEPSRKQQQIVEAKTKNQKKVVRQEKKPDKEEPKKKTDWTTEENIIKKYPNGDYVIRDSKGRSVLVISKESRRIPGEKPLMFTNKFERVLMQFAIPGEDIPPLPDVWSEEDVEEALSRPVNINRELDDELTIQRKEGVIMLKEEFAKARAEGVSSTEFVRELAKRQSLEASLVNETRRQVMQCILDGDLELAREMQKKFNEHLSKKGLPPMRFPKEVIGEDASPATNKE